MPSIKFPARHDRLRVTMLDEESAITTLFIASLAIVEYDLDVMGMDSEALLVELQSRLNQEIPRWNRTKLLLGQAAYFTDLMYRDLPSFIDFANVATAEDEISLSVFNPANAVECAAAVMELAILNPGDEDPEAAFEYSQSVLAYWGAILSSEGSLKPLKPLDAAIMPNVEVFNDPAVFDALSAGTKELGRVINNAAWSHGKRIFDQCKKLPTSDGEPAMKADMITSKLTSLVGPFDGGTAELLSV